jgi:uncharacterized membrane protein
MVTLSVKNMVYDVLLIGVIMVVVDAVYLSLFANFFKKMVLSIQGSPLKMDYLAASLCYLVLVFGLYYFIVSRKETILNAMLLGWVVYFVYEFTNKAILNKWSWMAVLIDGVWGGLLFGLTTLLVYSINGTKIKLM